MNNKSKTFLFCLALFLSGKIVAQLSRDAVINGYKSMYEYIYFDSVNKLSNHQLNGFKNSYVFYVTFKVDTTAKVNDLEIIEITAMELPASIKGYIEKLIVSTNGQWLPQINDSKKVVSDEFLYQVSLMKTDQGLKDRVRDTEPLTKYFLGLTEKSPKIERIMFSQKIRLMPLSY
jgi:hypothetical protein